MWVHRRSITLCEALIASSQAIDYFRSLFPIIGWISRYSMLPDVILH